MYHVPQKMSSKKKIELIVLIALIIWGLIFIVNYVRYSEGKKPIIAFHITREYDDGVVEEYISLGYVYRAYKRISISREEFVPFWVLLENPEALPDLPVVETDYNVPENPKRYDNYKGLVYFFGSNGVDGTYKCINSTLNCTKALSGYDEYNTTNKDPFTAYEEQPVMGTIHDKFAFIDDSHEQSVKYGDVKYSRIVYLYRYLDEDEDGNKPEILAKFADVKMSTYDDFKNVGRGDNNRFIVQSMDNDKWGLISIEESGAISVVLEYEYDSISFDVDTGYYILCKDGIWSVYDLRNKKTISAESVDPIYNVWENNNSTIYFKTGRDVTVGDETFVEYKIYRIDGYELLTIDNITQIIERDSYIMYVTNTDSILHFMDYAKRERYSLQLKFWQTRHDKYSYPAFDIMSENDSLVTLRIYNGKSLNDEYETTTVFVKKWENNN